MKALGAPLSGAFLILFITLGFPILAAAADGRIEGMVLDPSGRPVPAARVVLTGSTAAPRTTTTDTTGAFAIAALPQGRYQIRAASPGLSADPQTIDLGDGALATVRLAMRLSAHSESLVVSSAQVDQPLSRTPDSVTMIAGGDLRAKQISSLSAALRGVPGVSVSQTGGPGTVTSLFTRGGESDYTLVLVDGVRQNAFGGGLDLSQVPLDENVDRIEVVRGPQSAIFGADAIGGVIQIVTRSHGRPTAIGLTEFGSRSMSRLAGSTSGEAARWRWSASGDRAEDAGYTGAASNGETVTNDDARVSQSAASVGWRHDGSGADVQALFRYASTQRGTPGPYGSDPAGRFFGVDRDSRNLTDRRSWGARWVQPWFGASSRVRQRVEIDVADFDLDNVGGFASTGETARTHVRVQTDVAAARDLGMSGGIEWLDESARSTFIAGGTGQVPVERSVTGLFGEARWAAGERASVTAGLRAERIHRDLIGLTPPLAADVVTSLNPKVAASWLVAGSPGGESRAWTRVRGAAGTGIRPPDAFELAFTDNDGLDPERSTSAEIGVTQALAGGAAQADVTFFASRYDDLIVAVGAAIRGSSRYRTDNIANAAARGLEVAGAWRPRAGVMLQASYTFLDTEILAVDSSSIAQPPFAVGQPLLRRPRHQGSLDASWIRGRAGWFAQVQARGDALDVEPAFGAGGGLFVNPGSAVVHLGGSWHIASWLDVHGRLLNLFDRAYEEVLGYPSPGRTVYAGVRVAAGR